MAILGGYQGGLNAAVLSAYFSCVVIFRAWLKRGSFGWLLVWLKGAVLGG